MTFLLYDLGWYTSKKPTSKINGTTTQHPHILAIVNNATIFYGTEGSPLVFVITRCFCFSPTVVCTSGGNRLGIFLPGVLSFVFSLFDQYILTFYFHFFVGRVLALKTCVGWGSRAAVQGVLIRCCRHERDRTGRLLDDGFLKVIEASNNFAGWLGMSEYYVNS